MDSDENPPPEPAAPRRYAVFISYRHADNKEPGRQWASWLHHFLETYEVPADLVGARNQRGDIIPESLYPVFRDEEELPADADLSGNIRRALDHSCLLVVLCSPRAVESRFVADEIRYFKDIGYGGRILALMIDGEPNASDDPAKQRDGILATDECLPQPLRFGVARPDGSVDWTARTEPIAADVRPGGRPEQGYTALTAFREALVSRNSRLAHSEINRQVREYSERLELAKLKIVAGALGVPLGTLTVRQQAYQLLKARRRAVILRRWMAALITLTFIALFALGLAWMQKRDADRQRDQARQTLARSDFEEATRLLDDRQQTSKALAYLGSCLGSVPYPPALERLRSLLLQRSWLIPEPAEPLTNASSLNARGGTLPGVFVAPADSKLTGTSPAGGFAVLRQSSGSMSVIRCATGKTVGKLALEPGREWCGDGQFDPGEKLFAVADRQITGATGEYAAHSFRIRCFSLADWSKLAETDQPGELHWLACSPAGTHFAFAMTLDGHRNEQLNALPLQKDASSWSVPLPAPANQLAFSPDGLWLCAALRTSLDDSRMTLQVFDAFGGKLHFELELDHPLRQWAFSHDARRLALATDEPELRLINLRDGTDAVERRLFDEPILALAFDPTDTAIRLRSAKGVKPFRIQINPDAPIMIAPESGLPPSDIAAAPGGRYFAIASAIGGKGALELHGTHGEQIGSHVEFDGEPRSISFSEEGNLLAVGMDTSRTSGSAGRLTLFQISPQKLEWRKEIVSFSFARPVANIRFSPAGKYLLVRFSSPDGNAGAISLLDVASRALLPDFVNRQANIEDACFSPDGAHLATVAADGSFCIWDIAARSKAAESRPFHVPPASLDWQGDVVAACASWFEGQGEVMAFSPAGKPLWDRPLALGIGACRVSLGADGNTIAVQSTGGRVLLLDAKTGRPRTDALQHSFAVTAARMMNAGNQKCIGVACGTSMQPGYVVKSSGYVDFWDAETGRRIGDRVYHSSKPLGIEPLPDGRILSWSLDGAIISPGPLQRGPVAVSGVDFVRLTAALGGCILNEWRAPERYSGDITEAIAGRTSWGAILDWLRAPAERRSVAPDSTESLTSRLQQLAGGYSSECQRALDIAPDFAPAMNASWFSAASDAAKQDFMDSVPVLDQVQREQREQDWNRMLDSHLTATQIFGDPRSRQIADFATLEACQKHPEAASVWRERANFLQHVDRLPEAMDMIRKSLVLDPSEWDARMELYHFTMAQSDKDSGTAALAQVAALCADLKRARAGSFDQVCECGLDWARLSAYTNGLSGMQPIIDWLLQEAGKRIAAGPGRALDSITLLYATSGKLSDLLLRFPAGPDLCARLNAGILAILDKQDSKAVAAEIKGEIHANLSLSRLLNGEAAEALKESDAAVALCKDNPQVQVLRAGALLGAGRSQEALAIYGAVLGLDTVYSGLISIQILEDFQMMERRGIDLRAASDLRNELAKQAVDHPCKWVRITSVASRSEAERLGIKVNDRLLAYRGQLVLETDDFSWARLIEKQSGEKASQPLEILRGAERFTLQAPPGMLGINMEDKIVTGENAGSH